MGLLPSIKGLEEKLEAGFDQIEVCFDKLLGKLEEILAELRKPDESG